MTVEYSKRFPVNGFGRLAKEYGFKYPVQVLHSAAGHYVGTVDEDGCPYSRESEEYWGTYEQAECALKNKTFTQRWEP